MIFEIVRVDADLLPWQLEIETGSLEITDIDPAQFDADMPPWVYLWEGRRGVMFLTLPIPASDVCTLKNVPVGQARLVRPTIEALLDPSKMEVLLEVEVVRNETVRVSSP